MVLKEELFSQRSTLFSQTDWLQEFSEAKNYIIYWSTGSYGLEYKCRKSRDTGVSGKICLGVQNEAGQRLTEFCHKNTLAIANTLYQQHKRWLYTWASPNGHYWNQIDYILCSRRWRSSIQSAKTRSGADCSSDHQLLFAKFRLKLEKVGKNTRSFRYDLNQNPYDYRVEEMNRFKGLDLVNRVPESYGSKFITLYRRQWQKPFQEKEMQKDKIVV